MLRVFTVRWEPVLVALISASHKLKDVWSCHSAFYKIGPPERMMMAPLILLNLKRGSWMASQTAFPSWEPQQASVYVERQ